MEVNVLSSKFKFNPAKHGSPYDSFDLDKFYYVVVKNDSNDSKELLIFKKNAIGNRKVDSDLGVGLVQELRTEVEDGF